MGMPDITPLVERGQIVIRNVADLMNIGVLTSSSEATISRA
jgi:hypothetical protein